MYHKILITGTAGFIGFHLAKKLLDEGHEVLGLDNINDYYDVDLKFARLKELGIDQENIEYGVMVKSEKYPAHRFIKLNLEDEEGINKLFESEHFTEAVNLAAQAGVRYSLVNPKAYIQSNIVGFFNVLEACRQFSIGHLVYASSSSVYGLNTKMPLSTSDMVDHPISLYAATKKSNELVAHSYSHLYNIPTTGLRFFTVYGPWGRPDMAIFLFTKKIMAGEPIDVYNNGDMVRDFTYIDDIIEGVCRVMKQPPQQPDSIHNGALEIHLTPSERPTAPYKLYNIGNSKPVNLMDFIGALEISLGKKAVVNFKPLQAGDVYMTWADVDGLEYDLNYRPGTDLDEGIRSFVEWYRTIYL